MVKQREILTWGDIARKAKVNRGVEEAYEALKEMYGEEDIISQ